MSHRALTGVCELAGVFLALIAIIALGMLVGLGTIAGIESIDGCHEEVVRKGSMCISKDAHISAEGDHLICRCPKENTDAR